MRRIARGIAVTGVLVSMLACGADAPVSAPKPAAAVVDVSVDGRYGLSTVNNRGLPQIIGYDGIGAIDALSGFIELSGGSRFLDILTLRRRGASGIEIRVDTVRGDYLRADRTLLLMPDGDGEPYFFDVRDGKLTGLTPSFTIVYRKQ